jgi:hypothetical protein
VAQTAESAAPPDDIAAAALSGAALAAARPASEALAGAAPPPSLAAAPAVAAAPLAQAEATAPPPPAAAAAAAPATTSVASGAPPVAAAPPPVAAAQLAGAAPRPAAARPAGARPAAAVAPSGVAPPKAAAPGRAAPAAAAGAAARPASATATARPAAASATARPATAGAPAAAVAAGSAPIAAAAVAAEGRIAATLAPSDPSLAPTPGVAGEVTEAERDRYAAVLDHLSGYDGGPCFAALPSLGEETGDLTLEAFALTEDQLGRFRADMEATAGVVPLAVLLPILERQCPALAFIKDKTRYPEFSIYFDVPRRDLASGDVLEGRVLNTGTDHVSLLLIDDEGKVQNLDSRLVADAGSYGFEMRVFVENQAVATKQLLLALATSEPTDTVADFNRQPADFFFAALAEELSDRGLTVDAALIGFTVR